MPNPRYNKQVAQKRGGGGWETKGINEYKGSGNNGVGAYDQHNSNNAAGAYKVEKVMHEFKNGQLHSGSKSGPPVKSRKQAIAIAMSEKKKAAHGGY
jgi:hypothetical protein